MTDDEIRSKAEAAATKHEANRRRKFTSEERAEFVADFISGFRDGARQERERVSAIFALPEASARFESAKNLALQTSLPVDQVQGILATLPERREQASAPYLRTVESPDADSAAVERVLAAANPALLRDR